MPGPRITPKFCAQVIAAIGLFLALFGELAQADQVFVDSAGRRVSLPDKIDRAMAAGPPASVLLYSLAPQKMVGWVREPTATEKELLLPGVRDLPAYGRITGKGNTANIEVILSFKPDVILDVGSVDATYASLADRIQAQTGIPYVLIDGSFAKTPETLRIVGKLLNVTKRAEQLALYAETEQSKLKTFVEQLPQAQRPRVYYGRGPEGLETGLAGSINTEILEIVGAENVAAGAGTGSLANVSLEQILGWNPDVILTVNKEFFDKVRQDPLWSNISAVRAGEIFKAPVEPFGWFDSPPGVNRLIGVPWLLSVLYPEKHAEKITDEIRSFYKLFYQVDLTDEQLKILAVSTQAKSQ